MAALTSSLARKTTGVGLSLIAVFITVVLIWNVTDPVSGMVMPLSSILHLQLSPEHQIQTEEWAEDCVVQARLNLQRRGVQLTAADSLPFPGTTVGHELVTIWDRGMVNCGVLGKEIVASVTGDLHRLTTPSGEFMAAIWRDHLGLDTPEIARLVVLREVRQRINPVVGRAIPSLTQIYSYRTGERL